MIYQRQLPFGIITYLITFTSERREGLSHDFVSLLNKASKGEYRFKLKNIPRARLNLILKYGEDQGAVLFVNPSWVGEHAETKYLWSQVLYEDYNDIVSSVEQKIIYESPMSLRGLKFGAIAGRKYRYLEELFSQNLLQRIDVNTEEQAMMMLALGRVDVISQPRSITSALIKKLNYQEKVFISPKPLFKFGRHIMLTPKLEKVHAHLLEAVKDIISSQHWKDIKQRYGVPDQG